MFQPVCQVDGNILKVSIKKCEALAIQVLKTGVILKLSPRELSTFTLNLNRVNIVRRQRNVQKIPKDVLFEKKFKRNVKTLLPVGEINYDGTDLS